MAEPLEVELVSQWDGRDLQTNLIAELSLTFADFEPPELDILGKQDSSELLFLIELEKELQKIAQARFKQGRISINVEIQRGSLVLVVSLSAVGTAVYKFFKDYEDLRKGVAAFIGDLKSAASLLEAIVERHLSRGGKKSSDKASRNSKKDPPKYNKR